MTDILQLAGLAAFVVGVFLLLGFGPALAVAGVLAVAIPEIRR